MDLHFRVKAVKPLEENVGVNLCDTEFKQWLLRQGKKHKENKLDSSKLKLLCLKGYCQESEMTAHRVEGNICKSYSG